MKKIEAIVTPDWLRTLRWLLDETGVLGLTLSDAWLIDSDNALPTDNEPASPSTRVRLELVVADRMASRVVDAIESTGRIKGLGQCSMIVTTVEQAIRIRTGENGDVAV